MEDFSFFLMAVSALLGLGVGSFLNVLILRGSSGNKGRSGRSICLSCGKRLRFFDLFPILSFLVLKGRCRHCSCRISWQYPLVELATAGLFVFSFIWVVGIEPLYLAVICVLMLFLISSTLVYIFVYDLRHKIIRDGSALIFAFSSAVFSVLHNLAVFPSGNFLLDLLAGPISAMPFFLLWFFSGGRWMGLGDAKLMVGIGFLVGWSSWLSSLILSFWLGTAYLLFAFLIRYPLKFFGFYNIADIMPSIKPRDEIPFGPFIILAGLVTFFLSWNALNAFLGILM